MKSFNWILLIAFASCTINAFSQSSNIVEAHFKDGRSDMNDLFNKRFNEAMTKDEVHGCIISALFAKFTVDTAGNIGRISFSGDSNPPPFIKRILEDVIISSNGMWVPCVVDGKKVESKPFVLPFVYRLEAGCHVKQAENKTDEVLLNILNYKDGGNPNSLFAQFNFFNCIILPPLNIFTQQ